MLDPLVTSRTILPKDRPLTLSSPLNISMGFLQGTKTLFCFTTKNMTGVYAGATLNPWETADSFGYHIFTKFGSSPWFWQWLLLFLTGCSASHVTGMGVLYRTARLKHGPCSFEVCLRVTTCAGMTRLRIGRSNTCRHHMRRIMPSIFSPSVCCRYTNHGLGPFLEAAVSTFPDYPDVLTYPVSFSERFR